MQNLTFQDSKIKYWLEENSFYGKKKKKKKLSLHSKYIKILFQIAHQYHRKIFKILFLLYRWTISVRPMHVFI